MCFRDLSQGGGVYKISGFSDIVQKLCRMSKYSMEDAHWADWSRKATTKSSNWHISDSLRCIESRNTAAHSCFDHCRISCLSIYGNRKKKIRLGKYLITRQGVRDKDTKRLIQIEMLIMMNISRNKARRERHYERTSLVRTVSHSHGTKEMLLCNLK